MFDELIKFLFLFDEDLPLWNVVTKIDLENLHQVLEFGRIFPISTPNDNHHWLLENTKPMSCIDDPCRCITQMDEMPGPILMDNADDRLLLAWKDGLKPVVVHLRDAVAAKSSKFLIGWVGLSICFFRGSGNSQKTGFGQKPGVIYSNERRNIMSFRWRDIYICGN